MYEEGLSLKKADENYRLNLANKLNYHINNDEAFKSRYRNGWGGAFIRKPLTTEIKIG